MINLTGLSKAYDGNQVLNGIDLEVKKGRLSSSSVLPVPASRLCCAASTCWKPRMQGGSSSMTSPWIWPRPATSRPSNCANVPLSCSRTTPCSPTRRRWTTSPRADHRLEAAEGGGSCHCPGHPQDIGLAEKQDAYPASLSGGPATARRHRPGHGGPLQGDPV